MVRYLLRVPLHSDDPGSLVFDRLDGPVFGPGHGPEAVAKRVHGLMMQRIHPQLVRPENLSELAVGIDMDGMDQLVWPIDHQVWLDRHSRKMLHQRAAPGHVHDLDAATNGKNGNAGRRRFRDQLDLCAITVYVDAPGLRSLDGAVAGRLHIPASGEQQAVGSGEHGRRSGPTDELERHATGLGDPVAVVTLRPVDHPPIGGDSPHADGDESGFIAGERTIHRLARIERIWTCTAHASSGGVVYLIVRMTARLSREPIWRRLVELGHERPGGLGRAVGVERG